MKLYELTDAYNNIWELVNDESMDIDILDEAIKGIEANLETKVENSIKILRGLEADIAIYKAEENRLADRRKAAESKKNWLKDYLQAELSKAGIDKLKAGTYNVSMQNNPPSVEITGDVPKEYITVIPEAYQTDKRKIAEYLKAGNVAEWACLKQTKSLRVR